LQEKKKETRERRGEGGEKRWRGPERIRRGEGRWERWWRGVAVVQRWSMPRACSLLEKTPRSVSYRFGGGKVGSAERWGWVDAVLGQRRRKESGPPARAEGKRKRGRLRAREEKRARRKERKPKVSS
jgi:hypothetical protein